MTAITLHQNSYLPRRVLDYVRLGVSSNIQDHKSNILEKMGNTCVWMFENLPRKVYRLAQDPRVVTVAVTALALLGNTYLFYPHESLEALGVAVQFIGQVPLWQLKLGAYLLTSSTILGYGLRAEGRFCNQDLMDHFTTGRVRRHDSGDES